MSLCLSVLMPVYNEAATVATVLEKVLTIPAPVREVIVVDDGSTDRTRVRSSGDSGRCRTNPGGTR
jgi:glycosyltransferase involved in cell wall biosynthesis